MAVTLPRTEEAPRRVTILGSTGSIGRNTLDLLERDPEAYQVEAITAYDQVDLLARQARGTGARVAVVGDETRYRDLKEALSGSRVTPAAGPSALVEAGERPADWVMAAIVGAAGLAPTLAAVRRGAVVALANKECLVCAGDVMMREVRRCGATILPVDSEHNAIYQVFDFARAEAVERIILTASGGPFRTSTRAEMAAATPEEAIAHPNWDMGAKISVDSATMMNKGLELIEAVHLFPVAPGRIEVLVHPESVIHSMVAYVDGSVLAQLGAPDMRTPISYTLGWPNRLSTPAVRLDFAKLGRLSFEPPDPVRFPAISLARQALQSGGASPTILNAANEVAVNSFLSGRIGFLDIARVVEHTLSREPNRPLDSLDDVHDIDCRARETASSIIDAG